MKTELTKCAQCKGSGTGIQLDGPIAKLCGRSCLECHGTSYEGARPLREMFGGDLFLRLDGTRWSIIGKRNGRVACWSQDDPEADPVVLTEDDVGVLYMRPTFPTWPRPEVLDRILT